MGLDFTWSKTKEKTETAHWSYVGFNRFRVKVAESIGINLLEMKGFCPNYLSNEQAIDWNKTAKDWNEINTPLKYLLSHSDCDGQISAKRCGLIVPELKKAISKWDKEDFDRKEAQVLIKNMQECSRLNVPLIFT